MACKIHAKKKWQKIWATEVLSRSIKMRACSFLTAKWFTKKKERQTHNPFRKCNRWSTILGQQNFLAEISSSLKSSSITVWVENHLGYFAPKLRTRINWKCQLMLQFATWSLFSSFFGSSYWGQCFSKCKAKLELVIVLTSNHSFDASKRLCYLADMHVKVFNKLKKQESVAGNGEFIVAIWHLKKNDAFQLRIQYTRSR